MTNGSDKMTIQEEIASVVSTETYEDPKYVVDAVDVFTPQKRVLSVPLDVTSLFYDEKHMIAYVNNTIGNLTIEDVPNEEDLRYLRSLQDRAYAGQTLVLNTGSGTGAQTVTYVIDYVGSEENGYSGQCHSGADLYASVGISDTIMYDVENMISDAISGLSSIYASTGAVNDLTSRVSALESGGADQSNSVIISTSIYRSSTSGDSNIYVDIPNEALAT